LRLLVTRPEPDASETAARLQAMGHIVSRDPMLAIAFAVPPIGVATPGAIILTSRNALRALLHWPDADRWRDRPVFAVGPETGALARAAGFRDVRIALGSAAALTDLVIAEFERGVGPALYPAARNRAAEIDVTLRAAGIPVRRIEAYRAEMAERLSPQSEEALRNRALDGALFYSRRTANAFLAAVRRAQLDAALAGITAFVISEEAGEPLRGVPGLAIRVAPRVDGDALLSLIPAAG